MPVALFHAGIETSAPDDPSCPGGYILMYKRYSTVLISLTLTFLVYSDISADAASNCLRFRLPAQKALITAPACTLGVDSSCKYVTKTEIRVRYIPINSDTAVEVTLNEKYYPRIPFQFVWDMKAIPNQLFFGLGVIIDVAFADGTISSLRREGIFLAHQAITYPVQKPLNYEVPGTKAFPKDTFFIPSTTVSAFAQMCWNEKSITTRVLVHDPSFHANARYDLQGKMGIEILLDPAHKQKPYPTEEVMIFAVPLAGKPYRITYTPFFSDSGNFQLDRALTRNNFDYTVEKKDNDGFVVSFSIPRYLFGKTIPQEMGFNIVVKTANDSGKIVTSSLINARGDDNYSPLLWSNLVVNPKPVFKAQWIIWGASFGAGLLIPFLINFFLMAMTKDRPRVLYVKHTKEEKATFEKAKEAIDRLIIGKTMTIADVAGTIGITPQQLEKIIRKVTSVSYKDYVSYLRTEIVCERLRSSHSGEDAIAESCGFSNVKEMARIFRKYHHMTPANYRKAQQVTK
jgi:AraC-like DNA-binding protein